MHEDYPPFDFDLSSEDDGAEPHTSLRLTYPGHLARWQPLYKWFLAIPARSRSRCLRGRAGARGRDRGIERGLRQARGRRRLELIGVWQPVRPPAPRRARTPRPRPSPIPATAADAASPAASADRSGDPSGDSRMDTGIRCPSPAGRRRRMQPASHDEDTGVVLSVLVCQGWRPNHHHGPRPHFKHIRTTGPCVARCPASRVTSPRSNQRKGPGSLDVSIRKSCDPLRVCPGGRGPARSQPHDFRIRTPGLLRGTDASGHTPPHRR
jgi:hypothetical protein